MASTQKQRATLGRWTHAFGVSLAVIALILALGSYHSEDPSFSSFSSSWRTPQNVLGYLGSWTADLFFQVFGWGAWCWPVLMFTALVRWLMTSPKPKRLLAMRWWIGLTVLLLAYGLLADLLHLKAARDVFPAQGLLGILVSTAVKPFFGAIGSYLVVALLAWCFCMIWWEELPHYIVSFCTYVSRQVWEGFTGGVVALKPEGKAKNDTTRPENDGGPSIFTRVKALFSKDKKEETSSRVKPGTRIPVISADAVKNQPTTEEESSNSRPTQSSPAGLVPVIRTSSQAEAEPSRSKTIKPVRDPQRPAHWDLPPLTLLEMPKRKVKGPTQEQLIDTARKITNALKSFEIEGEVVEISPGPIITMYEFQPAPGVRVQKIMSASTDLAMTLGASSVRIVAPIPGKSVAGIEVPNPEKEDIVLRDVFELTMDRAKSMRLPLVLGKDGEGRPVCEDLSRMPHLLVGGATSMGKSVLVNSILTSLLCRFTPDDLKLIIVDPKLVEFKVFEDIPHLLLPIVNDASDASQALKWAVGETKRRYLLMQKVSAKNLESFNQKVTELKAKDEGAGEEGEQQLEKFPHIVIIIDELAELMLTAKKDVEQSIVRLTQLARAAGIHLIMATQRPSADVVTGLIKSNCPSRAALRVASNSDSRIILDCTGAEQLLGRGDMFFTNTGPMGLRRMQSAYVSDGEIEKVCDFWRNQGEPEYKEEILAPDSTELAALAAESGDVDPLYKDVIDFAKEKGKISTSLIQRRFQIGYTRAARIMEQLEANGVVGEQSAAGKPRDVVI